MAVTPRDPGLAPLRQNLWMDEARQKIVRTRADLILDAEKGS
jgi:hypothetical protein